MMSMEKANGVEVIHHILIRNGLARQVRKKAGDCQRYGGKGCEGETIAEPKMHFPLRMQVVEGTRNVGLGSNILDICLKQREG